MPLLFIVFFFLTLHAGTGGIYKFLCLLTMLVFQCRISNKFFAVNAVSERFRVRNSEPFITQTKAASVEVLQLSFRKTILNLHLRVQTTSKQLTISIFAPTIFRPTCMFTDKENSGRGITTRKFSRGIKQEYHKRTEVNYMSSWSTRVCDDCMVKEQNTLP